MNAEQLKKLTTKFITGMYLDGKIEFSTMMLSLQGLDAEIAKMGDQK